MLELLFASSKGLKQLNATAAFPATEIQALTFTQGITDAPLIEAYAMAFVFLQVFFLVAFLVPYGEHLFRLNKAKKRLQLLQKNLKYTKFVLDRFFNNR